MDWIYTKNYFTSNINNASVFPRNFVSFFKNPAINLTKPIFTKKHTKFLKENINKKIEHSFFTYKKNSGHVQNNLNAIWLRKESFIHFLPITFVVKKTLITTKITQKKQFIFLLKEIILGLQNTIPILFKENIDFKEILLHTKKYFLLENSRNILFYHDYLSYFFYNQQVDFCASLYIKPSKTKIYNEINPIIIYTFFNLFFTKNNILFNLNDFLIIFAHVTISSTNATKKQIKNFHYAKLRMNFQGSLRPQIQQQKIKVTKLYINNYIWKQTNKIFNTKRLISTIRKNYFPLTTQKAFKFKNNILIKQSKTRYTIPSWILYLLLRLEEKIDFYNKNTTTTTFAHEILKLYNTIQHFILNKQEYNMSTSLILTNLIEILKIRNAEWKILFLYAVKEWLQIPTKKTTIKTQNFFMRLWKKIEDSTSGINKKGIENSRPILQYKINNKNNFLEPITKQKNYQKPLNIRKFLTHEKFVLTHTKYNFKNNKDILTRITNRPIKIFFINALSLTKYAFNLERSLEKKETRSPTIFLQNIDRDLINKYKYIAIYIKDLIRICFIGMYLKKANVIAQFIAFQLGKLPRNRKETSFIKFIIKVVKTFAAEREEILGLRIKFSGRVNRWRRTKAIIGERGVIPLHTIRNQIEYGTAHAINRKGAVGIKIWIHYNITFNTILKESILKYLTYSKRLAVKKNSLKTTFFLK